MIEIWLADSLQELICFFSNFSKYDTVAFIMVVLFLLIAYGPDSCRG